MRLSRLFVDSPLIVGQEMVLPQESAHYLLNVLRLRVGAPVILFNGQGGEYVASLIAAAKKKAILQVNEYDAIERESALPLTLVQAISRPEHFNYTLQKAVELGVQHIVPVISERSPPLLKTQISKREQHWRKIIISACEQCGRNRLPELHQVQRLTVWLTRQPSGYCLVLSPSGTNGWSNIEQKTDRIDNNDHPRSVTLLIGAEGGLTETEIEQAIQAGYIDIRLGPRILRTETAAVAMLAVCQAWWGDLY
jgi:16S rRNA (uracil1498-N3)-methyltransferase